MTIKSIILAAIVALAPLPAIAQSANPFIPDYAWCATQGSVATRNATGWGCLTPGTNGQVLKSNGAGADLGWQTVTGTGTVTSVGLALPSEFSISGSPVTAAGTLTGTWASVANAGYFFASPSGIGGTPAFRAMVASDLPNAGVANGTGIAGTWPTLNLAAIADSTVLANVSGGAAIPSAQSVPTILDETFTGTGLMRRTGALTYTTGTTVSVAEGGTGQTSAGGASLDAISGMSGTGIVRRTGAATYTQGTTIATAEIADAAVTTAKLADAAVTTAKLADAAVTTAKLATPAASGASRVLVASNTATNAATLPLAGVFDAAYDFYEIVFDGYPLSGGQLNAQFGNGGTYAGDAAYSNGLNCIDTSGANIPIGATAQQQIQMSGTASATASYGGFAAKVNVWNPSETSAHKSVLFEARYSGSSADIGFCSGAAKYNNGTAAITDIRFFSSSGNITGTAYVYGIRKN